MSVPFHPLADGSICYDPLTKKYGVWRKFKGTNSLVETYDEDNNIQVAPDVSMDVGKL